MLLFEDVVGVFLWALFVFLWQRQLFGYHPSFHRDNYYCILSCHVVHCRQWLRGMNWGGVMQASLFFWAKSSVSACPYAVWRSNVLFSSNLCRITDDVIPLIKASLISFITDLLSRSVTEVALSPKSFEALEKIFNRIILSLLPCSK